MLDTRSPFRRAAVLAAAGTLALALAACGGTAAEHGPGGHSPTGASASPGGRNSADVAFAKGMVPHHRQTVEMAGLAPGRAESAEVKDLAAQVRKAQEPEITTLSGWPAAWGEETPSKDAGGHDAHGTAGGMMSAEDMRKLRESSGPAFDRAFLLMMIEHHEGAVAMAEAELADGSYPPAQEMADETVTSRTAEIERVRKLLDES
jgi:uncharacterized protein (DUF305 family)